MREVGMDGKRVIGVDVGKYWLEVAREDAADVDRFANEAGAIATLIASLNPASDVVVFERTGGYERALEAALAAAGISWAVVHSLKVKAFREVQGIKAKTDRIDAQLLRAFGRDRLDAGKLRLGRPQDVTLAALMTRRRQLDRALHAEKCRLETAAIAVVHASIERMIAHLKAEFAATELQIAEHEARDPQIARKEAAMCERKGVAIATARSLLAELPELGRLDRKEITALAGLAPRVHQSGTSRKRRGLSPGRTTIKVILFNPARSAMRWDAQIRTFCNRLRARGKPGKVIMVAVMRKMLVQLNAAVRDAIEKEQAVISAAPAAAASIDHGEQLRRRAQAVKAGRRPPPKAARSGLDGRARSRTLAATINE
jgi:transposase